MPTTKPTTMSLDLSVHADIRAIQAIVMETMGTRLNVSRVVSAAVTFYARKLKAAAATEAGADGQE